MQTLPEPGATTNPATTTPSRQNAGSPTGPDVLITLEAALVTLAGVALANADALALDTADQDLLRVQQCQDEAHYHFWAARNATPTAAAFTLGPALTADRAAVLTTVLNLKALVIGAGMALARSLAGGRDATLAEILFGMGGVETAHQALVRQRLGMTPANERAFAEWRFVQPADALAELAETGMLSPRPDAVPFPGPVARRCAGVRGLVPETTDDALLWTLPPEDRRRAR